MSNLSKRAMLVCPAISLWTARRHDKKVSEEVAKTHDIDVKRGRYNKCVIDVEHPTYLAPVQTAGVARRYHAAHTLPWSADGLSILSAAMHQDYVAEMTRLAEKFQHEVDAFRRAFPGLKRKAKQDLNGMYRESDYPDVDEIGKKFGFRVRFYPVPEANDFRVTLDNDDVAAIRAEIERDVEDAVKHAERDRWTRLLTLVEHAFTKLSSRDAIFRDSLIENIAEQVKVLPKLAVLDNPDFDVILGDVATALAPLQPERLRTDADYRSAAAIKAAQIAAKMAKLFPK